MTVGGASRPDETGGNSPLPGLERPAYTTGDLEESAGASIKALEAEGLLTPAHALPRQLVLALARAVDRGVADGKASAAAMAAAQLREAWALLPQPGQAPEGEDPWALLARELREAAEAERARLARVRAGVE